MTISNRTVKLVIGECLCRTVAFEVADEFVYAMNCHCSNCRRTTGSAFKPMAGIGADRLRLVRGADNLLVFGDESAGDVHCGSCGSLLYSVVRNGQFVHVPLGVLAGDIGIRPTHHIYVASKAPWFEITDDLPQYEELD